MRASIHAFSSRLVAVGLVIGVALTVAAPAVPARADTLLTVSVGAGIGVGGWALGLAVADTVSFAMGSPWDDGWAAVELTTACVLLTGWAAGSIYSLVLGLGNDAYSAWLYPFGLAQPAGLLGGYLLAHSVWSLATNDRAPGVGAWLAPTGEGIRAGITGTF